MKAASRTLILSNTAIEKLKRHKKLQQLEIAAAEKWNYNNLIFCRTDGEKYAPGSATEFHRRLMASLGLDHVRLHDLRHTAATLMLQEGIHPKAVQEIMGHASISTTLGIYGHVTPGMREQAANVMDDLLAPIPVELKRS